MKFERSKTIRGFESLHFKDRYDSSCSLQKSSLAGEECIWLGIDDPDPKIMASEVMNGGTGWVKYPIPESVLITTRMHLTQEMAKELVVHLKRFIKTGELSPKKG